MRIIHTERGWYICIDMADVGFAESIWYETEEELAKAVIENKVTWETLIPASEIRWTPR